MDIGMLKNNHDFYDGYEGEGEVTLRLQSNKEYELHIWEGYFEDIFGKPIFNQEGWKGFTRDYQESLGVFEDSGEHIITDTQEYPTDLEQYKEKSFSYEETKSCLQILIEFFVYAQSISSSINVELN